MRSKLKWTNNELDDLLRQLDVALEASGIGIWQHNLRLNQTRWDEQLQKLYGVRKGEHDVVWLESVHPDDYDNASTIFEAAIRSKSDYASQFRIIRPDGEIRHVRSRAKYFVDSRGEECFIGAEWDVTEDVLRNEQLAREREDAERSRTQAKYAAEHDYLTGLVNRRAFDENFAEFAAQATGAAGLCHLDVDHFKEINDRFGHASGDAVLRHVASILADVVEQGEVAARLGGDEFAVLSPGQNPDRIETIVRRIRDMLSLPLMINGEPFFIGVSVGMAFASGDEIASLLTSSDVALYEAKNKGRNRDQLFTPALAARLNHEKQTLHDLRHGLLMGEIVPYYQAQVQADDLNVCGFEALARWERPDGVRLPADFLHLAAENGLMEDIDDAILRRVLFDMASWTMAGVDVPRIAVNISAARLGDPNLPQKLSRLPIPRGKLSFELIETIFLDTLSEPVKESIRQIKELGIGLEIDDLGSGHASLLGLVELRPVKVKIDRHLVRPLLHDHNATQRQLIRSLIDIARALNITVVAEGIETVQHGNLLASLGVDILQGFAFGRPEPAHATLSRLLTVRSSRLPALRSAV